MFVTPKDIDTMSVEQIVALAETAPNQDIVDASTRNSLCELIYTALGYDLSNDLRLALISEPINKLILATAGSGKTTCSQLNVILEKIYRKVNGRPLSGDRILCLVFNVHNVQPMIDTHKKMVSKLYSLGIKGLDIDYNIKAKTVDSFCLEWTRNYAVDLDRVRYQLIEEFQQKDLLLRFYKNLAEKEGLEFHPERYGDLKALYDYLRQTLRAYDDCEDLDLYHALEIPSHLVKQIFTNVDNLKKMQRKFDFIDTQLAMYKLLKEHDEIRDFIQNYYDYIVADEVQDFNPLFMEILKLIKGPNTPMLCVGDEDQSVYGFRGADVTTILDFDKHFENAKVYSLSDNRRCRENIVQVARDVLSWNTLRFGKPIKSVKNGGTVEYIPYSSEEGQLLNLCSRLKAMSREELEDTCICYRNRKSSLTLADKLTDCGINFHILSGYAPFSHEMYKHMIDILDALYRPNDRDYSKNLYKLLPIIKKNEWFEIIGYDAFNRKWTTERKKQHFSEYDLGKFKNNFTVINAMKSLVEISSKIATEPLESYISDLFKIFYVAFWDSKMYLNKTEELDKFYTTKVLALFMSKLTYPEFEILYQKQERIFRTNNEQKIGCMLSTFHKLKGLEKKNVFIIDLKDDIYPNFAQIDSISYYTEETKLQVKEEETRLFYVAVTRALDNLYMYYSEDNPSLFISKLLDPSDNSKHIETVEVDKSKYLNKSDIIKSKIIDIEDIGIEEDIPPARGKDDVIDITHNVRVVDADNISISSNAPTGLIDIEDNLDDDIPIVSMQLDDNLDDDIPIVNAEVVITSETTGVEDTSINVTKPSESVKHEEEQIEKPNRASRKSFLNSMLDRI